MSTPLTRRWTLGTVLAAGTVCAACTSTTPSPPAPPAPPAPTSSIAAPLPPSSSPAPGPTVALTGTPFPSAPPVPTGISGQPRGASSTAATASDPDGVAQAFATVTFTFDTALDRSPFDAQARSATYATPTFAATLKRPLVQAGGQEWNTLAAHHGFTTVGLVANNDDGRPADQLRAAARGYTVTVTGHGDAGWSQTVDTEAMYLYLTRTGGTSPWQVDRVSFGSGQ